MKRHLRRGPRSSRRAACGQLNKPMTNDPMQVTCLTCMGSLYMADLETLAAKPRRRRRNKEDTNGN